MTNFNIQGNSVFSKIRNFENIAKKNEEEVKNKTSKINFFSKKPTRNPIKNGLKNRVKFFEKFQEKKEENGSFKTKRVNPKQNEKAIINFDSSINNESVKNKEMLRDRLFGVQVFEHRLESDEIYRDDQDYTGQYLVEKGKQGDKDWHKDKYWLDHQSEEYKIFKELHALKEECVKQFPLSEIETIAHQASKYPLILDAVSQIRDNLKMVDKENVFNKSEQTEIKAKLRVQFENLIKLAKMIQKLTKGSEENSEALTNFVNIDVVDRKKKNSLLAETLQGKNLTEREERALEKFLSEEISKQKKENANLRSERDKELKNREDYTKVLSKAIQMQAELHKVIREAKSWQAEQPDLQKRKGDNVNQVCELYNLESLKDPSSAKPIAYFKKGVDKREVSIMEEIMWNIALLLGMEEGFAPTGQTDIYTASALKNGNKTAFVWNEKGELDFIKTARPDKFHRGGVQKAIDGELLGKVLDNMAVGQTTHYPSKDKIIEGILNALVMGMFDAHADNIMVTKSGEIKYFDNTRCLPNSNGFIKYLDQIISSFRSVLLDLEEAGENLTSDELQLLSKNLATYKEKMQLVRDYFNKKSGTGQRQLEKLPPSWLDIKRALDSTDERIENMEKALREGKVKTLRDLAIQAIPDYKLSYALSSMDLMLQKKQDPEIHGNMSQDIIELVDNLTYVDEYDDDEDGYGVNLEYVKKLCEDQDISFKEFEEKISDYVTNLQLNPPSKEEKKKRRAYAEKLIEEIKNKAELDCKDIDRESTKKFISLHNETRFWQIPGVFEGTLKSAVDEETGVRVGPSYSTEALIINAAQNSKQALLGLKDKDNMLCVTSSVPRDQIYQMAYQTPTGYRVKDIHLGSKSGKVDEVKYEKGTKFLNKDKLVATTTEESKEIGTFVKSLLHTNSWPTSNELLKTSIDGAKSIIAETDLDIQFSIDKDNGSLIVTFENEGDVEAEVFARGSDSETFFADGKEQSLEDICKRYLGQ